MYQERIANVASKMRDMGLPQIIVTSTASVYYLTGHWVEPHERMLALLLDDAGNTALFGNTLFALPEDGDFPIVLHSDGDDALKDLAAALRPGRVGIDKLWYSKFLLSLMEHRPDIFPVIGSDPVDEARKCKDEAERESMRRSSLINDEVISSAIAALKDGVCENQLASFINARYLSFGADCEGPQIVSFGANGADPHHAPDSTVLQKGDSIVFDIFTPINRYWCDMTRTVFYKSVSGKQREVYDLVRKANETAIAQVRPGVKLSELDSAARGVITDAGYGEFFTHRLGHGCGLDCHEPPDVSASSDGILSPGMIFSIEPGIYLPGQFGVRIEDLVLVTEGGCEVLNKYPKDLQVIG